MIIEKQFFYWRK